jgi:O-antigen/teichoic acid export membrane protein
MKIVFRKKLRIALRSTTTQFALFTYLAIAINVISGVLLARTIGPTQRGKLAYYANFLLLTSFISAANVSNGTARTLVGKDLESTKNPKSQTSSFIFIGFLMAAIPAYLISTLMISEWEINKKYFIFLIMTNALGAFTSLYDGYWRFNNSIKFLTWNRFIGLAAPSIFIIILILLGKAEIRFLLLGQFIVTILNLGTIIFFQKKQPRTQLPESREILKSAFYGFPTYLAEYFVSWVVPFFILRVEGSKVLGWYVIALSYALLADVSYSALEAKNYKLMSSFSNHDNKPQLGLFLKNSLPVLGMHLVFIPFAFLIPFVYGKDFANSSLFAIVILVARVPIVIARSITSFLVSVSRNVEPLMIFLSFLIAFTTAITLTDFKLFLFHWIFAYILGAIVMLSSAVILLFKLSREK